MEVNSSNPTPDGDHEPGLALPPAQPNQVAAAATNKASCLSGNVDALWLRREQLDQILTPTNNTATKLVAGISDSQLMLVKSHQFRGAKMGDVEENRGSSSSRGFNLFKCGEDTNVILDQVKKAYLVMATLIATVTFAAAFAVASGVYGSEKGPTSQGFAILSRHIAFKAFIVTDILAFFMSICSILMHFYVSRLDVIVCAMSSTMTALIFMVTAFVTGAYAVSGYSPGLVIAACVLGFWYFLATIFMVGHPSAKAFYRRFFQIVPAA